MDAPVNSADRRASAGLFVLAALAWLGVAFVVLNLDPRGNTEALLYGALLLGVAIGATLAPLLWLAAFALHHRIAYRGDWWRAGRRAALCGLVAFLFVLLRGQDALGLPLALFIGAMAVLVELTLALRR